MKNFFLLYKNLNYNYLATIVVLAPLTALSGPFFPDLLIVISIISFIIFGKISFFYKAIIDFKIIKLFFLFWIFLIISSIFSNDIFFSLKTSIFWMRHVLFSIIIYFVLINNENFIKYFYYIIVFVIIFASLDGIFQFILGYDIFGYPKPNSRLGGPFGDEQILGSFIVKLLPLTISLSFFFKKKNLIYLLLFFSSIAILLSAERTSIGYLFIILFLVSIFCYKEKIFRYFIIYLGAALILIITQVNVILDNVLFKTQAQIGLKIFDNKNITENYSSPNYNTQGKQFYLFSEAHESHIFTSIKIFKNNLFFGAGPKMFRKDCSLEENYINQFSCTTHPHNSLAQILAETGLFGLFFYILFFLIFVKEIVFNIYKFYKKKSVKIYYIFALFGFFPIFTFFLPSGNIFNNFYSFLLFLPLGFILYFKKYE